MVKTNMYKTVGVAFEGDKFEELNESPLGLYQYVLSDIADFLNVPLDDIQKHLDKHNIIVHKLSDRKYVVDGLMRLWTVEELPEPEPTKRIVLSVNVIAEVPQSYETTGKEEINMDNAIVLLDADYPESTSVIECNVIDAFDI